VGAPHEIRRRAHVSCLQEIDHAERCFALASGYAGEELRPEAMPELLSGTERLPGDPGRALVQVATAALVDGALLEDYNAELASTALAHVVDPAARLALARIVRDEREHARLAWDIVAFAADRGGAPVVDALRETFARVPDEPVSLYAPELAARVAAYPDRSVLDAHGRVRPEAALPVYRERLAAAAARLAAVTSGVAPPPRQLRASTIAAPRPAPAQSATTPVST